MKTDVESSIWLEDPRCWDAKLAGNKAASLARLATRYNVPAGFVIPTRSITSSKVLQAPVQTAIEAAYQKLGEKVGIKNPAVAVRSSAWDEDGAQASFAGMHDTFLNITGLDAILEAVQKIYASAVSERTVAYRQRRGLSMNGIHMAFLVQQLVTADVSGVAFSVNPVTGSQDEIIITASWGFGESIVAGTVTPDTITVSKSDLAIITQHIGHKMRMTVAASDGTKEVVVPRFLQEQPCLGENEVQAIARMARKLESEIGLPVDVEFVLARRELFLLQCRPVTAYRR